MRHRARTLCALILTLAAGALTLSSLAVVREPEPAVDPPGIVNDISRLNPVRVAEVLTPTTTQEIVQAVSNHPGPISIGGARHSMGGQIAAEGSLHIDMRRFNRILEFDAQARTIRVQAGTRWRQIQEHVHPSGLAVANMQSYASFTVGGSLSVNAHGRYVGAGPLISSVRSLEIVLADGSRIEASPSRNTDVFYGAIGGYGGLGVITEVTLGLADNVRVERRQRTVRIDALPDYVVRDVLSGPTVLFNGDLYPDDYDTVHAVSYVRTERPVTLPYRLVPATRSYRPERWLSWVMADWPLGKAFRRYAVDPIAFRDGQVSWLNHEASYDTAQVEPASRTRTTYLLQEYFVPVPRTSGFVQRLRDVLRRHRPNVLNVSIRHARRDPGSLLAWAREDVFGFVLFYKQSIEAGRGGTDVGWTRQLIDAALDAGGSYYLPYQVHATEAQFLRAYPRAPEFFALKRTLDPGNKFRNRLWDQYDRADPGGVR